ncbi:type I 3-dehydroquinate dehydratase [Actinomyces radicidentis]|uniref:type I 3-dehydroquinate dehydratase n=1 Tax=Actinomyces radicidentis TaxID=111015 RepID=UPI0026DECCDE|nr:type I 3-dehydroquinate dehydratase [Actinomyces radicidentis]
MAALAELLTGPGPLPVIAVATTAPDADGAARQAGQPVAEGAEVVELRAVRAVPGTAAVLLTVRSGLEGGALDGGEDAYAALLDALLGSLADLPAADRPDALDVEIARPAAALLARAHPLGLDAGASFHDFHGTPADDALRG